ncbi:hypothetical protein [Nonomuraea dietziae]
MRSSTWAGVVVVVSLRAGPCRDGDEHAEHDRDAEGPCAVR